MALPFGAYERFPVRILGSERPKSHIVWAAVSVGLLALASLAFVNVWWSSETIPGGSSPVGFAIGLLLAAIIIFECALYPRKLLRRYRLLGPMHLWMRVHIWLGLICVPLTFLHSGFTFGGTLSTWLTWTLILVIASGIFGLLMQNVIPRLMLDSVPSEIILAQAPERLQQNLRLARELMFRVDQQQASATTFSTPALVGAETMEADVRNDLRLRSLRQMERSLLDEHTPKFDLRDPRELFQAYSEIVDPYLAGDHRKGRPLVSAPGALAFFSELRKRVEPDAETVVMALEGWCRQRRQIERQRLLTFWLHGWIPLHLFLSAVLLVLMMVHAWLAVRYW